jgi:hypothetical protein
MFTSGGNHPDAPRPGAIEVAAFVDLHPVGDAVVNRAAAREGKEHPTGGDRSIICHVERPDVHRGSVDDIKHALVEREAQAVGPLEIVGDKNQLAILCHHSEDPLKGKLLSPFDAIRRSSAIGRISEVHIVR